MECDKIKKLFKFHRIALLLERFWNRKGARGEQGISKIKTDR